MSESDQSRPSAGLQSVPAGDQEGEAGGLLRWLTRLLPGRGLRNGEGTLHEALEELIEESGQPAGDEDPATRHERMLLSNIIKLHDLTAYDIMVPRADIVAVAEGVALDEIVDLMARQPHSRLPVYRDSLDNVAGMVHIKDVLASVRAKRFELPRITRMVLFVSPSVRVLDLLLDMRKSRTHMAIVVDEYGGTDGLVTIEDLVETIVGEIEDEHDLPDAPRMSLIQDGLVLADARTPIEDFETQFGPILTEEEREDDIDTLGGLVFTLAGRVPGRGALLTHESGISFEVIDADPRRVKRLRISGVRLNRYEPEAEPARPPEAVPGGNLALESTPLALPLESSSPGSAGTPAPEGAEAAPPLGALEGGGIPPEGAETAEEGFASPSLPATSLAEHAALDLTWEADTSAPDFEHVPSEDADPSASASPSPASPAAPATTDPSAPPSTETRTRI